MCRYATTFEKIASRTEARPWRPMTIGAFGEMEEQKGRRGATADDGWRVDTAVTVNNKNIGI